MKTADALIDGFKRKRAPVEFIAKMSVGDRFTINRVECVVTYVNAASGRFSARPVGSFGDGVRKAPGKPETRKQELLNQQQQRFAACYAGTCGHESCRAEVLK